MKKYQIDANDLTTQYFHFTKKSNLESIEKMGLLPKRSFRTKSFEKTKKVFFVKGLDQLLVLLNCWITDCEIYPHIPFLFPLGTKIKGTNPVSKRILKFYFQWTKINPLHQVFAYCYFDFLLENSVLLKLDLMEGTDFDANDIDQVKAKGYSKELLIHVGYSPAYSDLESTKMDEWNMHTISGRGVENKKIQLCYLKDEDTSLKDILIDCLNNTKMDIQTICPNLYAYLKSRKYEGI